MGKCPNEIRALTLKHYMVYPNRIVFTIPHHTKTSRPQVLADRQVEIKKYIGSPKVCPVVTVLYYIKKTSNIRKSQNVLIVTNSKGTEIAPATLARWTKNVMDKAGIDTCYFKPYSTRSAAASKQASVTSSLTEVLKMGCWRKTSTFFQYYLRQVKYFACSDKEEVPTGVTKKKLMRVPASPVLQRARHTLAQSKMRILGKKGHVPYTDLPSVRQQYKTSEKDDEVSIIFKSPCSSQAPSPTFTTTVPSHPVSPASTVSAVETQELLAVISPPPHIIHSDDKELELSHPEWSTTESGVTTIVKNIVITKLDGKKLPTASAPVLPPAIPMENVDNMADGMTHEMPVEYHVLLKQLPLPKKTTKGEFLALPCTQKIGGI